MKRLTAAVLMASLVVFASGCGDIVNDTGKTLVISQAEEDIVGAIQVDVTAEEEEAEQTAAKQVKITAKSLNVRETPSADAARITTLKEGDVADYLGEEDGWYQISGEADGESFTGYVSGDYAEVIEPENAGGQTGDTGESAEELEAAGQVKVTAKTLKVRESASTEAEVIASLKKDDTVQYISQESGWYKIFVVADGKKTIGYISADYAEVED